MVDSLTIQLVVAACTVVGAIVGINQVRTSWNDKQEKSEARIKSWISESDNNLINNFKEHVKVIDGKFNNVDTRISKDEEDIEDVEDDMKSMVKQFTTMCNQLQKHTFVIESVVPEFKQLKREFYRFKNAVDTNTKVGFTGIHNTNDNIDDPEKERKL